VGALAALIMRLVGTLHSFNSTLRGGGSILKRADEVKLVPRYSALRRECGGSGVPFPAFSACNVNSRSATNARFPRLWTSHGAWPGGEPEVLVDNFWIGCLLFVYQLSQPQDITRF
jgi:hypothetical protein